VSSKHYKHWQLLIEKWNAEVALRNDTNSSGRNVEKQGIFKQNSMSLQLVSVGVDFRWQKKIGLIRISHIFAQNEISTST